MRLNKLISYLPCLFLLCICIRRIPVPLVWAIFRAFGVRFTVNAGAGGVVDFAFFPQPWQRADCGGIFVPFPDVVRRCFGGVVGGG